MLNLYRLLQGLRVDAKKSAKTCRKSYVAAAAVILMTSMVLCGNIQSEASQTNVITMNNSNNDDKTLVKEESEQLGMQLLQASTKLGSINNALQNEKLATEEKVIASRAIISTIKEINANIENKILTTELSEAKINTDKIISANKVLGTNTIRAVEEIKKTTVKATAEVKNAVVEASVSTSKSKNKSAVSKKTVQRKLSNEDYNVLLRIVEAEATGEDLKGKILVANVVLNRVDNKQFPNTVKAVVFQKNGNTVQFSPTKDGRYWSVKVSKDSKEAVERALSGEDYSKGALFFSARSKANKNSMSWFDRSLKWLFKHGAHEFYTTK